MSSALGRVASKLHLIDSPYARVGRSLQLGVGVACTVIGAEALLAPLRFARGVLLPHAELAVGMPAWGLIFIGLGGCLTAISVLEVRRLGVLAVSIATGVLLCAVAGLRLTAQAGVDAAAYALAGLGVLAVACLPTAVERVSRATRRRVGATFWMSGRVLIGLALIATGLVASAPRHDWAATALYLGLGMAALVGPVVVPARPLRLGSVRVRMVLMMALVTGGPVILASLAIATSAETSAIDDALADQLLNASDVAQTLNRADSDYRTLVTTLAQRAGFANLNPQQQRELLQGLTATNVYAFATFDADGQPLARSDDRPLTPLPTTLVDQLRQVGAATSGLGTVPGSDHRSLVFAAPYFQADGGVAGYSSAEIDFEQMSQALGTLGSVHRPGTAVFILDADGKLLLHPSSDTPDAATRPPNLALANANASAGTLRYRSAGAEFAAGYARTPALGWTAITSYPLAYAVVGVQNGREWAFGLLVLAGALSTILGLFVADRVVRPLNLLSNAIDDLAAEATATPLPESSFAEVERMSRQFGAMRQHLVIRTAERESALASAREAIQVRDEFMSIAAHELKTPVTAMRGHAQLLLMHLRGRGQVDPQRLRNSLERIDSQSHKLARLIEQLLDVARLERGTLTIDPREVDLRDLVAEVVVDSPQPERIVTHLPDVPLLVNADQGRLEQVLSNLIDNALKFSPQGGDIEIELQAPSSATVRLTVRDYGLGIPPEHRSQVFERFHQAHADSHRSGFGLGLYIAKQIIDLHAGSIHVDSPTSGGTRVWVDLPRVVAAPATAIAASRPAHS